MSLILPTDDFTVFNVWPVVPLEAYISLISVFYPIFVFQVISARKGEFETGFDRGGQTREHAMLVKTTGVKYLVVLVNKMDDPTVNWNEERFAQSCFSQGITCQMMPVFCRNLFYS